VKDDSELITGVFVVQLGFGSAQQVMAAAAEWATRRAEGLSLSDVLMQRGLIDADKRKMVEALSGRALQVNGGDVARTLQSLSSGLKPLLSSISHSMVGDAKATKDSQPQADSLEGSENVSDEPIGRYDFETGPHRTTEELGRGGIGRVVVVHDRYLGREVALKELLQEHTSNPAIATMRVVALEQRFLREARLTGQLDHPAIVPVFELGRRLDGGLYYTMQRVRGRTLHELLVQDRSLEGRLKHMGAYVTVCHAIAYAHSRAVVHRDIKPQNIMVGQFGETYVLDWGLARVKGKKDPRAQDLKLAPDITGNVLEGGAIGTPSYMSPEQAEGRVEIIDERSDVWCLGAVLYEILTGTPPYTGVNPFDVLAKIAKQKVLPVRERVKYAPAELAAIAEKALQHKREDRYANAAEMAKDVEAWISGARVGAHEYTSWELLGRFARRNKIILSAASIATAVLLVAGAYAVAKVRAQRDQAREFAQLFLEDVSDKLAPIAGSTPLVEQLTHKTLEYYRNNVDAFSGPRDERLRLTGAWNKIGRLAFNVDKLTESESAFNFAQQVAHRLVDEDPADVQGHVVLSAALVGQGDVAQQRGDVDKADARFTDGTMQAQRAVDGAPEDLGALDALSRGYSRISTLYLETGRDADATEPAAKALEVDKKLSSLQPGNISALLGLSISQQQLAEVLMRNNRLDEARALNEGAVTTLAKVLQRAPQNSQALRASSDADLMRASLLRRVRDEEGARVALKRAYETASLLVEKEPDDVVGLANLSLAAVELGNAEKAYSSLSAQGAGAVTSLLIEEYAVSMFLSGRYSELLTLPAKAPAQSRRTVCAFAALAAAMKGDAEAAARLATEAAQAPHSDLRWILDQTTHALSAEPGSALRQRAAALSQRIDEAERKNDHPAMTQALLDFAKDAAAAP
jgi:serine/threonine protein kinase